MTAPAQCGPEAPVRLAFRGDRNRPGINPKTGHPWADVTGAFDPESRRYAGEHGRVVVLENAKLAGRAKVKQAAAQREAMERAIVEARPDEVAVFCHGFSQRIELGYSVHEVDRLAAVLAEVGCHRVALHACLTGKHATNGFAAQLRDAMVRAGLDARVLGSTVAGHASMNPHRRIFTAPAGSPGEWIVEPRSAGWKAWCKRMRDADDPLRFTLLDHDVGQVRAAV